MGKSSIAKTGHEWDWYYHKQKLWKKSHGMENEIRLRGNKNWCKKFGEDLSLPRFIGDKKTYVIDGKHYYPPYDN